MNFGPWDPSVHETIDAIKRIQNAEKIKPENVVRVDTSKQCGQFAGRDGNLYSTTLSGCDFVDFYGRGLPCKHIYKLADLLGFPVSELLPKFDPYAAYDYDVEEDVERLRSRFLSGQLTADAFIKAADALHGSAAKAKRKPGRPRKI